MQGYYEGKQDAERALLDLFPEGGVALRPGFIYGTRMVGSVPLPLGLVGTPLNALLTSAPISPVAKALAGVPALGAPWLPPVSVEAVGRAAVAAGEGRG